MFQPINNYEEYSALLKKARLEFAPMRSNLFLFPDEVKQYINSGIISYMRNEDSLVFIKEEKDINRLYYCLSPNAKRIPAKKTSKYIVVEIPRKTSQVIDNSVDDVLTCSGFSFFRRTIRMKLDADQIADREFPTFPFFCEGEEKQVSDFLYEYFDVRADFIPDLNELKALLRDKMVFGTRNEAGDITSCMVNMKNKNQLQLHALAIDPNYRDRGLATKMFAAGAGLSKREQSRTVVLWTGADNILAQGIYKKFGFSEDGCYSDVYYMDKEV